MKNKSLIALVAVFLASMFAASCSDMLSPKIDRNASRDMFAKDTMYSIFGILKSIQKVGERTVLLDAARSDLSTIGDYTTDSIKRIANFEDPEDGYCSLLNVADYYHIINSCNFYLTEADTLSSKNGVAEMKREYAQVQVLRGWAYLQLVRFYGEVPFVTEPVSDAKKARELEKSAERVTKDNLADKLVENGLYQALMIQKEYNMPYYSSFNNGSGSYSSRFFFIPAQLVLGDAYLIQHNYPEAARMYYDYLYYLTANRDGGNLRYRCTASESRNENGVTTSFSISYSDWLNCMKSGAISTGEQISGTVGAANTTFGTMLTGIQRTFGFETSARQSGSGTTVTATVTTTANERFRQILPSDNYVTLNRDQSFCYWRLDNGTEKVEYAKGENVGDGRLYATAPYVQFTEGVKVRIIDKFCTTSSWNSNTTAGTGSYNIVYNVPFYRLSTVYLRYAEAINRMGFPRTAFAVLKDGLIRQNFPTLGTHDANPYLVANVLDSLNQVVRDTVGLYGANGDSLFYKPTAVVVGEDTLYYAAEPGLAPDSTLFDTPYFSEAPRAYTNGIYYMTVDEMVRMQQYPYMDFITPDRFSFENAEDVDYAGIHSRGCGTTGGTHDTIYTFAKQVAKKLAETWARQNNASRSAQLDYEKTLQRNDTLLVDDEEAIINAVEDLIVDENALEGAFEGHRFTDLLRFADNKTHAGFDGTNWFAWKMARRNNKVTDAVTNYDAELYAKMQNPKYWFFSLPK